MSPVIEAFLQAQAQRTNQLEGSQRALQAKEHLEQLAKEFEQNHALAVKTQDMEAQKFDLLRKAKNAEMLQQGLENIQSGKLMPPGTSWAPPINPGINIPGTDISAGTFPKFDNRPAAGTPIKMNIPGLGDTDILMPRTQESMDAEKEQRALANAEELYKRTVGKTKDRDQDIKEEFNNMRRYIADSNNELRAKLGEATNDTKIRVAEINAAARREANMFSMMLKMSNVPINPEDIPKLMAHRALGLTEGDFKSKFGPQQGPALETAWLRTGMMEPPKGLRDKFMKGGEDLTNFINNVKTYQNTLPTPTNTMGKVANTISGLPGMGWLSQYRSKYQAMLMNELPRIDLGLGLTPGTLGRAPKLADKMADLWIAPTDDQNTQNFKLYNGADLFLSGLSKQIRVLPPEQRKLWWADWASSNPDALQANPKIMEAVMKAKTTGTYTPGEFVRGWLKDVGNPWKD